MSYAGDGRLGGGPADAWGAIRRATSSPGGEGRPSQGRKESGDPSPITTPDKGNMPRGDLVEFTYPPDLPKFGFQRPEGALYEYYEGLVFIEFIDQKQLGWKIASVPQGFSRQPADGFSGKIPAPLKLVDGLPHNIVQPEDRH